MVDKPDLEGANNAVKEAHEVVLGAARRLGNIDENQVVAYDVAHAAAAVELAYAVLDYGEEGDLEAFIACAFAADMVHDLAGRILADQDHGQTGCDALGLERGDFARHAFAHRGGEGFSVDDLSLGHGRCLKGRTRQI